MFTFNIKLHGVGINGELVNKEKLDLKENALVSVIIPVYNAQEYVAEALESVFNQTYKNIEIIVVNDGSSDNSLSVLQQYEERITLLDIKNRGVSYARNYAVKHSAGQWLAFLDADDEWLPAKLSSQLESIGECSWSYCNAFYFGRNLLGKEKRSDLTTQYEGDVFDKLILENFITTSTVLIEKQLFVELCGFDSTMKSLEDWKLWLLVAKQHKLAYVNTPLAKYRVHSGSTSRKAREILPIHLALINDIFILPISADYSGKLRKLSLGNSYNICSYIAEDSRDYKFSLFCALNALKLSPVSLTRWKHFMRCIVNLIVRKKTTKSD